jgi:two-component system, chemotaxis family, response regulator PixG
MAEKKLIYVIDDDTGLRTAYSASLHKLGYDVETASDGQAAMVLIKKRVPDLILLDLLMPNMDGISFLRTIRQVDDHKNIKVVVVSNFESIPETEELGVVRCLSKIQLEPDAIAAIIQQILDPKLATN